MKTQQYTLDEIFEKKLLFLIPFYIFTHESRFEEYEAKTILQSGIRQGKIEGKIEGKIASIMELLEEHGTVPDGLRTCIQEEKDMEVLKLYLKKASRVQSVEEFEQWVLKERNKKM